jgi:hypothetical protein
MGKEGRNGLADTNEGKSNLSLFLPTSAELKLRRMQTLPFNFTRRNAT